MDNVDAFSYYKITIGGRDEDNPITNDDCKRVSDALKSRGYSLNNFVANGAFMAAKIEPKIKEVDISALEGICTIVEDAELSKDMRSV